jgi:hypothetical protein
MLVKYKRPVQCEITVTKMLQGMASFAKKETLFEKISMIGTAE